jgi:hypothetical protein
MTSLIIKQAKTAGGDSKTFRAYRNAPGLSDRKASLGISASTTGNAEFAVQRCAAKAFVQFTEPYSAIEEVEQRIRLVPLAPDAWMAMLQEKGQKL